MARQRWYGAKSEPLDRVTLVRHAMLQAQGEQWLLAMVETHGPAEPARYFVPLAIAFDDKDEERTRELTAQAVAKVRQQATMGVLADAMADLPFCRALIAAIGSKHAVKAEGGTLRFLPGATYADLIGDTLDTNDDTSQALMRRLVGSSNSVSLIGDRLFLKAYRKISAGINPEVEMGRYLTDTVAYKHCVPVAGSVEFHERNGTVWTLALLQGQLVNQGDAWAFSVDQLVRLLQSSTDTPSEVPEGIGAMVSHMQVLAQRVAELHIALAQRTGNAAFEPEPIEADDIRNWVDDVSRECHATLALLTQHAATWTEPQATLAAHFSHAGVRLNTLIQQIAETAPNGLKTRLHGDLHLGQILIHRNDFVLIDFEGEPNRTLEKRRAKQCALRDVAGMLRSFDYARHAALEQCAHGPVDHERFASLAQQWLQQVRAGFLQTYSAVAIKGGLYPDQAGFDRALPLLKLFELEKALYEARYEMDNRPDWVGVPLAGILSLAESAALSTIG
jgi:maltose alpha-D-glucosyltransferase/alpha-amylase